MVARLLGHSDLKMLTKIYDHYRFFKTVVFCRTTPAFIFPSYWIFFMLLCGNSNQSV